MEKIVRGGPDFGGTTRAEIAPADELAAQLLKVLGGIDLPDDEEEPEAGGKISYRDCSYTSPGPPPFICGTCEYLTGADDEMGMCSLIDGPYRRGAVDVDDSCRFYKPVPHGEKTVEDDASHELDSGPDRKSEDQPDNEPEGEDD